MNKIHNLKFTYTDVHIMYLFNYKVTNYFTYVYNPTHNTAFQPLIQEQRERNKAKMTDQTTPFLKALLNK